MEWKKITTETKFVRGQAYLLFDEVAKPPFNIQYVVMDNPDNDYFIGVPADVRYPSADPVYKEYFTHYAEVHTPEEYENTLVDWDSYCETPCFKGEKTDWQLNLSPSIQGDK